MHLAGKNEKWRHNRFTNTEFVEMQMRRGRRVCPLLTIPGVTIAIFRDDWLHSVDQGVGADFLGNLFVLVMRRFGGTKKQQSDELWSHMVKWNEVHEVKDKLKSFDWNNVHGSKQEAPKLRGGNAATTRALIPFGNYLAERFLDSENPEEDAAKQAAHHLLMCYQCLSKDAVFKHEVLLNSSISFALQYCALRDMSEDPFWRIKPKMHRFLEMCSQDCIPNLFWTYRDEDFGGTMGHQSRMRGAWAKVKAYTQHSLDLFALQNPEPRMVSL